MRHNVNIWVPTHYRAQQWFQDYLAEAEYPLLVHFRNGKRMHIRYYCKTLTK